MSSSHSLSREIRQSWNDLPADVKAAYQRRAAEPPTPSQPYPASGRPAHGRSQRMPFATCSDNTANGSYPPQISLSHTPHRPQGQPIYQQPVQAGNFATFDPSTFQLDPGPFNGSVDVSLGTLPFTEHIQPMAQNAHSPPLGYSEISALATQITTYNIPFQQVQLVASSAIAPSSAQFSAGYPGHHAPSTPSGSATHPPSIEYYLSTLSTAQLVALREHVRAYIASLERQRTHNRRR